jgi:hypothetical protein
MDLGSAVVMALCGMKSNMKNIDISGKRFGRLTAIKYMYTRNRSQYWLCKCDCGKEVIIQKFSLGKLTNSCGCLRNETARKLCTIHGKSRNRLYILWNGMIQRCHGIKNKHNERYQNKKIIVYDEWKSYEKFEKWALANGYKDDLSIDRINNDGNYCPENCRWVTIKEQAINKEKTVIIEVNGIRKSSMDWSRELGSKINIVSKRINRGWDNILAATKPIRSVKL